MRLIGQFPHAYLLIHCSCRWPSQWGGEGEEGSREAPGGWDCAGVPAGLSWGGVRRQPPVPRPWSLPAQVWQLLFTLALQECLLQSLLHQISLDTDTGGAKECVCSYIYICACVCGCGDLRNGSLCVCGWVLLRTWYQLYSGQNHQRVTKRHLEPKFGDWTNMYLLYVSQDMPMLEPVIEKRSV